MALLLDYLTLDTYSEEDIPNLILISGRAWLLGISGV